MQGSRRVVVTGLGIVSPVGTGVTNTWQAVLQGCSGAVAIEHFDTSTFATKFAALVKDFNPDDSLSPKEQRRLDPFIHYGVEAARQAIADSGLSFDAALAPRVGVAVGSGIGGLSTLQAGSDLIYDNRVRRLSPFFIPGLIINMLPGMIAEKYNCQGPNVSIVSACASASHNIGYAARTIVYGDADIMIAGAAEKGSTEIGIGGFNAARALSTNNASPEQASRPWDKDRDGFVLGDGAGILVLEEYEHAKARGANIYAELVGFGMSGDAHHMTAAEPNGRGFKSCITAAINDAGINVAAIDYVNAHGTSTLLADPIEHNAVKFILKDHAKNVAMSSTKSMTGHLLGAAGGVEAIFSILAIRDNVAPPTINLDNPDAGCDMNLVAHTAQERTINTVLTNSFGFGGTNASLIFQAI